MRAVRQMVSADIVFAEFGRWLTAALWFRMVSVRSLCSSAGDRLYTFLLTAA